MSTVRVCIATTWPSCISETVSVIIHGKNFNVHVKEVGTWNTRINCDLDCSESEEKFGKEESRLSNEDESHNDALDDFMEQVVELNASFNSTNEVHHEKKEDGGLDSNSIAKGVESDTSIPPGFESLFQGRKENSHSSYRSTAYRCSTSFGNHNLKLQNGLSFIDEINRMIEVGDALGYDVKGCKQSFKKLINGLGASMMDK
ncbi:hypothetical protein Tco_0464712 [Tanacetum coccineum]